MIRKEGKDMGEGGRVWNPREKRLVTILRCQKDWKPEIPEEKKKF